MNILDQIESPADLRKLDAEQLEQLATELRAFMIKHVSQTGGHLASSLGAVELTLALHRVYDTGRDRILFDVGHQSYVHKILTGRRDRFGTLRRFGGISGFPKPCESAHDAFIAGHASNSVSAALGMARARTILGERYGVAAVIGDGALTGGLSYEALSDAGQSGEPLVVVLNDNEMSITRNVGGVARLLSHMRARPSYYSFKKWYRKTLRALPGGKRIYEFTHKIKTAVKEAILNCSMFEEMGFTYLGPVDGHDIKKLTYLLGWAKGLNEPVLLHVMTKKGKGYAPAEENPDLYHGVGRFVPETGVVLNGKPGYSGAFGGALAKLAAADGRVCAVTAAMQSGTGLTAFAESFPDRFFDVGIAEEHAVCMAAGMAKQGLLPVVAIYSTFLQRAFDMLIHDVAILGLHVVLAVDRAGLVGEDGETHHGVFDVGYLCQTPGMTVLCPSCYEELSQMLQYALYKCTGPVALRYPRGCEGRYSGGFDGSAETVLREGSDITLAGYGGMVNILLDVSDLLAERGVSAEIVKLNSINTPGFDAVYASVRKTGSLLVAEACVEAGCVGARIAAGIAKNRIPARRVLLKNLGNRFIPHGNVGQLLQMCALDARSLAEAVLTGAEK